MINELQRLSRDELIKKWQKLFKNEPPKSGRKEFLIKHIIWQIQAKKYGGYSTQTIKQLEKLANKISKSKSVDDIDVKAVKIFSKLEIKAGTKLIREFKGQKHEVAALEKGFEYKGKKYKSLSAIANEITGTRWNGKVFFGLRKPR
ncbi:MAG: DUF2924 domain-containing protein [Candidatus Gastranaerophilales bacterium]|nr:DUF2924 domain-containing protein [Candidatus Gastranaerophilales bacterium]